ncbi:hypothetical protein [Mesorhizobium sp. B2-4-19]|uniref:hypothetical protein n=1 Tax=Mesorhizobium sp. B2-4-19 TaxID=2589930 RepID=UPI001FEE6306|nr:hypothetical protein [Mesorhizobium sp. B2-4-19]
MVDVSGWNITSQSPYVSGIAREPTDLNLKPQVTVTLDFRDTAPIALRVDQITATTDLKFFLDPMIRNDTPYNFWGFDVQLVSLNNYPGYGAHPPHSHFHDDSNPGVIAGWANPVTGFGTSTGYDTTQTAPPNDPLYGLNTNSSTYGGINGADWVEFTGGSLTSGSTRAWDNLGIHQFPLTDTTTGPYGGSFYVVFSPIWGVGSTLATALHEGDASANSLQSSGARDILFGNAGADSFVVNGGVAVGGDGNDTFNLAGRFASLYGQDGDDTFIGSAPGAIISGGGGTDTLSTGFALATVITPQMGTPGANPDHTLATPSFSTYYLYSGVEKFIFTDGTVDETAGSYLVDDLFYFERGKDVWSAHVDAEAHYNAHGWHEGRNPNPYFNTNGYLAANPDVANAKINPLQHFDLYGWKEGRDPSAGFDNELYREHNPDVKAAGIDPLAHFLKYGQSEGRQAYAAVGNASSFTHGSFDPEYYLLANPDVAKAALVAGGDTFLFAFQHYEHYGWHEGRNPNSVFDVNGYLDAYTDVKAAGIDPLLHYDHYGWKEGRDPSAGFDTKEYEAHYADVAAAHVDPLLHYLAYGIHEGRLTFGDGLFA